MSIASSTRNHAGTVLSESKSSLSAASQRLESLAGDTRSRARSAVEETRSFPTGVLVASRRQAYAQLGASDALVAVLTKRSAELPRETKQLAQELVETTKARITTTVEIVPKAQGKVTSALSEAKDRGAAVARTVRSTPARTSAGVKNQIGLRAEQLKDAYVRLGQRGEQVAADLRHDPVVVRVIGNADSTVEKAANQLTSIAQKVRSAAAQQAERERATATSTPVRPTAARQVPAHRTIARNTPAGAAPISTTPIHRAAAYETETRKAAAVKAARTRQEREHERELAAQARSEAAAKAAATRKENAELAAAARQAAALKAAQTRKDRAMAREQAAKARSDAAAKAAQTRKDKAEAREQAKQARSDAAVKAAKTRKTNQEPASV